MTAKHLLMLGTALGGLMMPGAAVGQAFNGTPATVAGAVTYDRGTPGVETITVESPSAIILWRPPFGDNPAEPDFLFLPAGNVATFQNGPNNTDFAILNRIFVGRPSRFDGTVLGRIRDLLAGTTRPGGTVLFSSPGGIIIGATAVFDVGNLVLTSLNVVDDGAGNFGGQTGDYVFAGGANRPNAAIMIRPGAQITALNQGSYVAFVAPRVLQGGSVRANGSIAYVAGEEIELRVNNGLFDIIVNTGSDNAIPIIHTGTTGGPPSGAADDFQRIFMVAVPKNQAITAILEGNVGFDDAVVAGVENGAIILSAGYNVVDGAVDRFGVQSPGPVVGVNASFHIRGGTVRSDLFGYAVTDMLASGQTTGSLAFLQDVSLFGEGRAHLFAGTNQNVTVTGNALVSAAHFDSADGAILDLTGGEALIFAQGGGSLVINGGATVDASAQGRFDPVSGMAGSGTAGTAGIFGDNGTVQIDGDAVVLATGGGAKPPVPPIVGGEGTGGTAFVEGRNGGQVQIGGSLTADASGTGTNVSGTVPVTGAAGTGGTVRLGTTGGGTVTATGPATLIADGRGGGVLDGAGNVGGAGRGGDIRVTVNGGAITLNSPATLNAGGIGGFGPRGGAGDGGDVVLDIANGQIQFTGDTALSATGTGGNGAGVFGGSGGNGTGGTVTITARTGGAGGRVTGGGALGTDVSGTGGRGANATLGALAGTGGVGRGGGITLTAEAGNAELDFGALTASANGVGGAGGDSDNNVNGGGGGEARGGNILVGTVPGAGALSPNAGTRFASAQLFASGFGGTGGLGSVVPGNGFGGNVTLSAAGAPVTVGGDVLINANGVVGNGGVGQALGGSVTLAASDAGGTLTAANVQGFADALAFGAPGSTTMPGEWHVRATGGGAVQLTDLSLSAAFSDVLQIPAFSSIEALGGTIRVSQVAVFGTAGEIRVIASGAGTILGGSYILGAGTDLSMSHSAPIAGGFTMDVSDLSISTGDDFDVGAGVVTRSSNFTGIVVQDVATVAGRILGANIVLAAATLDVATTGEIGGAGTASTNVQVTGNVNIAGQILGQGIVLRSAGLDVAATGIIGAGSTSTDVRATGNANIAGQLQGQAIVLRSAGLNLAVGGTIGSATTTSADVQATGDATISGQIQAQQTIVLRSAGLAVGATGAIGGPGTVSTDVRATGNANVAGQIQGNAILLRSAGLDLAGTIGGATAATTDVQATGNANLTGQIQGQAIVLRSAGLDVAATGAIGTANTATADVQATGSANIAGQVQGGAILLRSAGLDVSGLIGGAGTATTDVRATGDANVTGQIQGQAIVLRSAGLNLGATGAVGGGTTNSTDILATGAATVGGQVRGVNILLNAASLDLAGSGSIGGAATDLSDVRTAGNAAIAGQVTGRTVRITSAAINIAPTGIVGGAATNQAELRATGTIGVAGRLLGANILAASSDIDLPAAGAIGDAATQLVTLQPNTTGQSVTLGGIAQGAGYTLTGAEAGRIRAGTLRLIAPAIAGGNAILVRDVTFNGGGAAAGIGTLEIATPGVTRVEGALLLANAAAGNGISINSGQRIEVTTPTGSVRVRDGGGAPGGTLLLTSANIWAASQAILDRLGANPNYPGRDAELLDNGGNLAPRGFIEGNGVTLIASNTLFVQNTGPGTGTFLTGTDFGGITVGAGGLTVRSIGNPATVTAFGRRLNADGTMTTGDDFFFSASYQSNGALAAGFTPDSTVNTCIIVTGQCAFRAPPTAGPGGPDPTTGPVGDSASILLPPGAEADDLVDTSFAAEGLIEEPVTSGGDGSLWETDCDRDNDGDCDEDGQ